MIFTLPALGRSLADYLAADLPGAVFYADPNQQGTKTPALFLRQTNARIAKKLSGRYLRRLGLDLVYLVRFNIVDAESRLLAADMMDLRLDTFPYCSGEGEKPVRLRTYDRHWEIAADYALHYKFDLQLWLTVQEDAVLMQSIQELNMEAMP